MAKVCDVAASDDPELRILILEDNPLDSILMQNELRKAGIAVSCMTVDSEIEYKNAIKVFVPDIILSDFDLPTYSGFEALNEVCSLDDTIPFIIVSGVIGEDLAIEAFKRGATDCINKNRLGRLPVAIRRAMDEHKEKIKLKTAESALAKSYETIHSIFFKSIQSIANAVEFRDP